MFPKNYPTTVERIMRTMRNPHQGFPWTGYSGMDLSSTDKAFNCGMRVYTLPFCDASRPEQYAFDKFDEYCYEFKNKFRIGDNVNAIVINGQTEKSGNNVGICGQLAKYTIDNENKRIRVYVRSDKDFELYEVYPETIFNNDVVAESIQNSIDKKLNLIFS